VRGLIKRFDSINSQYLDLAYVLAKRDTNEYASLLEAAERAIPTMIKRAVTADMHRKGYAALDDPNADWCKAALAMLNQGPVT
jgi:hypothetical protein